MNNIIFLDCTVNYGYGFGASNTKIGFLAQGLVENGDNCIIHNGIVGTNGLKNNEIKRINEKLIVISYKIRGSQLISWVINTKQLFLDLKKYHSNNNNNIIINDKCPFHFLLVYFLFAKIFGYKWVSLTHEWLPTIKIRPPQKQMYWLYTKAFGYFSDAFLPISEYIINKISKYNKPYLKIPVLADYSNKPEIIARENYYLYCVSANYYRVIIPLIDAYNIYRTNLKGNNKLILVLGGTEINYMRVCDYINNNKLEPFIITKRQIPYNELLDLYRKAKALLIPLDPRNEQDHARFSQKIAEYLSVGTPVLSNNVGEISFYFKDKENIVIAEYSKEGFAESMKWIDNNSDLIDKIGLAGYYLGKEKFNYSICGKELHNFLLTI